MCLYFKHDRREKLVFLLVEGVANEDLIHAPLLKQTVNELHLPVNALQVTEYSFCYQLKIFWRDVIVLQTFNI